MWLANLKLRALVSVLLAPIVISAHLLMTGTLTVNAFMGVLGAGVLLLVSIAIIRAVKSGSKIW